MSDSDAIARLEARVRELESTVDDLRAGGGPAGRALPKPPLKGSPDSSTPEDQP